MKSSLSHHHRNSVFRFAFLSLSGDISIQNVIMPPPLIGGGIKYDIV